MMDGDNTVSETLTINVGDINEAPTVTTTLAAESFAENTATGTTIATTSASDPEAPNHYLLTSLAPAVKTLALMPMVM